jgi:hypothetical protein
VIRVLPLLVLVLAMLSAGCAAGGAPDTSGTDPVRLAAILPTPAGLRETGPARAVGAHDLAAALGGTGGTEAIEGLGLKRAAVREWTGAENARLLIAVSVWGGNEAAQYVNGAAAERELAAPGTAAWTPEDLPGSRGARRDGARRLRALSFAVDATGVYVRADGPVEERAVIREADLLSTALRGKG